jgi:hypothetical protein
MECQDQLINNSLDGRGRLGGGDCRTTSFLFFFFLPRLKNETVKLWEAVDEVNPFRCIGVVKHHKEALNF